MGRKTYEDHESALPGRLNIVISRQRDYPVADGIVLVNSLEEAQSVAAAVSECAFIIGGVELFTRGFELADTIYETVIDAEIDGEAILPDFDFSDWDTELLFEHASDARHAYAFRALRHDRRQSPG